MAEPRREEEGEQERRDLRNRSQATGKFGPDCITVFK